ncbi:hypothetical protein A0H81_02629 [Grifola frondosa]|uniref:Uncharacterized protein n=1 Tax=Grifola frondosa TaxID=5627 RepID=A0A1C7MLI6_GRIFR|nr:hypothetical protein A0H81_02629 [Grifola frondosa]
MPGPRAKGKTGARPKPKSTPRVPAITNSDTFVHDIENAEGWEFIANILCEHFDLPDLTTRSGLKKVHARFPEYYKRLDNAYIVGMRSHNEKLMGGIVGIWAKMSADVILRDKLFKEGLVSKMIPLLDMPLTRHVALRALSTVTHHGGVAARQEIARQNPTLVRLIQELPDDPKVMELATVTMAHATSAVLGNDQPPNSKLLKDIDVRSTLKVTVENLRKPTASHYMMSHAFGLLTSATLHCFKECKAQPQMLRLLVACLRSNNLSLRCNAIGGLVRLNHAECEQDIRFHDPHKFLAAVSRRFPDNLVDVMMDFGPGACDTTLTLKGSADYQKAMMQCAQDRDLYALGKTLSQLILRTEFSIAEGGYQAMNERTGKYEIFDIGLPFKMWTDALPHCAKALRAHGSPADLDMADIVELKFLIIRQRIPEAVELGQRAVERNPKLSYAYYAISMGADNSRGLRAVKKGLMCKNTTPFVRNYMLWRAVEHAGNMGVSLLQEAKAGDKDYAEGVAFLMSAFEDAKTFVSDAPPDARHMHTILNWYIILALAIRGPELSENLGELNVALNKLDLATNSYPAAVKEWGDFIARFDKLDATVDDHPDISPSKAEDDLAAWLDNLRMDDGEEEHPHHCAHPKINTNSVALYRCSWCGNPSAVLRKCAGCGKTR